MFDSNDLMLNLYLSILKKLNQFYFIQALLSNYAIK